LPGKRRDDLLYLGWTEVIFPIVVIGIGKDDYDAGFPVSAVSDY
jgi:hypothetical protein